MSGCAGLICVGKLVDGANESIGELMVGANESVGE